MPAHSDATTWSRSASRRGSTRASRIFSRRASMDPKLLDILVCPICKGPLIYDKAAQELISVEGGLAYPIQDDIPVMLEDEARRLSADEIESWRAKR